jgi:hypothetical protein
MPKIIENDGLLLALLQIRVKLLFCKIIWVNDMIRRTMKSTHPDFFSTHQRCVDKLFANQQVGY